MGERGREEAGSAWRGLVSSLQDSGRDDRKGSRHQQPVPKDVSPTALSQVKCLSPPSTVSF